MADEVGDLFDSKSENHSKNHARPRRDTWTFDGNRRPLIAGAAAIHEDNPYPRWIRSRRSR
jgi:hypothetical protein